MRKRYQPGEVYPAGDARPLDMGDGSFVLISGQERLMGVTPEMIRAQDGEVQRAAMIKSLDKSIEDAMQEMAENAVLMPSEAHEYRDPERLDGGSHCANCHLCGHLGDVTSNDAALALLTEHLAGVEHDRAEEAHLRKAVETARTALYDYLKSKGRVA